MLLCAAEPMRADRRPFSGVGDVDEADEEEHGEEIQEPVLAANPGGQRRHRPVDHAEAEAVGNRVGKGNHEQGKERRDATSGSFQEISVIVTSMSGRQRSARARSPPRAPSRIGTAAMATERGSR